jgi:DNA-binding LytR/AlgR family response regulator
MPAALIAEDEPLLRRQLREMLAALWPELDVVCEADDGIAALAGIERHLPDVAFLDIRMPGMSGLDVARQCGARSHIVFITAYDDHAVAAFESGAIDYVLKPVDAGRLATTITRLKHRLTTVPPDLGRLLSRLAQSPAKAHLTWVQAATGNKLRLITVDEIVCFQADSKYTKVLTREAEALIRKPIKELADELDPEQFWQIHRSTIVNIRCIDVVQRHEDGRMDVMVTGRKERFAVSQTYQHRFRQM